MPTTNTNTTITLVEDDANGYFVFYDDTPAYCWGRDFREALIVIEEDLGNTDPFNATECEALEAHYNSLYNADGSRKDA